MLSSNSRDLVCVCRSEAIAFGVFIGSGLTFATFALVLWMLP